VFALPTTDRYSLVGLHRPVGDPAFGARERRLLHLFHTESGRPVGTALAVESPTEGLSPRLREVLGWLLEGEGEKQVAARLRLSGPTVHQYATALYRHFGVGSRAELLARFIRRPPRLPVRGAESP